MSQTFDPYHKWLGIPLAEQPPNHYRLLGINPFEADPDVIEAAADQRMAHVRTHQWGAGAVLAQRLLNEIASAKICLLAPDKKREYDAWLMSVQGGARHGRPSGSLPIATPLPMARPIPVSSPSATPVAQPGTTTSRASITATPGSDEPIISARRSPSVSRHIHHRKPANYPLVAVCAAAAIATVIVAAFLLSHLGTIDQQGDEPRLAAESVTKAAIESPVAGPPEVSPPPRTNDQPKRSPPESPPPADQPDPKPLPKTPVPSKAKLPVPDESVLADVLQRLREEKSGWSPRRFIAEAQAPSTPDLERFALLWLARDAAAAKGDITAAFESIEEMDKRFVIDVIDRKADALWEVERHASAAETHREVAAVAFALADRAMTDTCPDLAKKCGDTALLAARRAGDTDLIRRMTLRVFELGKSPVDEKQDGDNSLPAVAEADDVLSPRGSPTLIPTRGPGSP